MNAHPQFADDLALLALGTLQGDERVAVEKHLEECPACRRELERLRGDMALLALSASGPAPPQRSRERLLKAIAKEPRAQKAPGSTFVMELRALVGRSGVLLAAGFFWQQSDRLAQRVARLQDESTQQQARARTRPASRLHSDLDGRAACDSGGGANSSPAAGESNLCSGSLQPDFPGQQPASPAAAEGI